MYLQIDPYFVQQILSYWDEAPKETAYQLIEKYGLPSEATLSRLIWYNNGIWKRTIIYNETVPHNFPTPHQDFLEQVINYKVPEDLFDEIAKFDGSIYIDRTKGEISAKCHLEPMNILSLNLVHDIVTGKRNVEDARKFYAEIAKAFKSGNKNLPYTQQFQFNLQVNTADPGVALFY